MVLKFLVERYLSTSTPTGIEIAMNAVYYYIDEDRRTTIGGRNLNTKRSIRLKN